MVDLEVVPTSESGDEDIISYALLALCTSARSVEANGDKYPDELPTKLCIYYEYRHIVIRLWKDQVTHVTEWEVVILDGKFIVHRNERIN